MSRRAMILLILAIIAVHGILLWLVVATGDNEQKIADTRKQIAEENALLSEMEDEVQSVEQKDSTSVVQKPDSTISTTKLETSTSQSTSTQQKPTSNPSDQQIEPHLPFRRANRFPQRFACVCRRSSVRCRRWRRPA
ncbi:MAG: hypothetical protein J6W70_08980, partial [Lentisphaeria bacterium]|nr:hypothetical protein [Lentisphaeria bacterium]